MAAKTTKKLTVTSMFLEISYKCSLGCYAKDSIKKLIFKLLGTRKYSLRGYILGVLTHTTALDRL